MSKARMTITVEAPDIVLGLIRRAVEDSPRTLVQPESIWPGYEVDVVSIDISQTNPANAQPTPSD